MKEEKVDREGEKERVCNARAFKVYPSQIFSLLSSLSLSLSFSQQYLMKKVARGARGKTRARGLSKKCAICSPPI